MPLPLLFVSLYGFTFIFVLPLFLPLLLLDTHLDLLKLTQRDNHQRFEKNLPKYTSFGIAVNSFRIRIMNTLKHTSILSRTIFNARITFNILLKLLGFSTLMMKPAILVARMIIVGSTEMSRINLEPNESSIMEKIVLESMGLKEKGEKT